MKTNDFALFNTAIITMANYDGPNPTRPKLTP